jgi:magnesium-transporting ATPase (P-type)
MLVDLMSASRRRRGAVAGRPFKAADRTIPGAGSDRRGESVRRPSWHGSDGATVLEALGARSDGLTGDEAAERLRRYGPNEIPQERGASWPVVMVRQFHDPLIYALGVSAVVALALGRVADGAVVLAVVVINALIGFVQEFRAGRAIQALAQLVSQPATARRDGIWTPVPAEQLVPGDVVEVTPGDRVNADLRVLEGLGLRADESALTGESVPVGKSPRAVAVEAELSDRSSVLHAGTLVSAGTGRGLVVDTGTHTELGRISGLMHVAEDTRTPLTRTIARLGTTITWVIGAVALVLLGIALARGYPVADAALAAITLAVAAIPEGLPAIVTIALAVGVRRMAARRAIVRELPAVETLGSTGVVCTDKTGTLTRNEMVVRRVWSPAGEVAFEGVGYAPQGRVLRGGAPTSVDGALAELLEAVVLANEGRLEGDGEYRHVIGDPTDGALLVAAERGGLSPVAMRARTRRGLLPFDSEHQYMAAAYESVTGQGVATYLKGAPEVLLAHVPAGQSAAARPVLERWTGDGLRVLAVARREGDDVDAELGDGDGLRLLGLVAMIDPPRAEVVEAIAACHTAGVDVKMITGDHPATATAIGRELGIVGTSPALTGPEIAQLSDDELGRRVRSTVVFARVSPEHKLRLVRALQRGGAVTAMTGDGVNDAPALRQATSEWPWGQRGPRWRRKLPTSCSATTTSPPSVLRSRKAAGSTTTSSRPWRSRCPPTWARAW